MSKKHKHKKQEDFWADYHFILMPGPPVETPTKVDALEHRPYIEEHPFRKSEKGIVFFPTQEAAKAYRVARYMTMRETGDTQVRDLSGLHVAYVTEPGALANASREWGCTVAYSYRFEGGGFHRDITEFREMPELHDGQNRLRDWRHLLKPDQN